MTETTSASSSGHLSLVAGERSQVQTEAQRNEVVHKTLEHTHIKVAPLGLAALETIGEPAGWSAELTVLPIFSDELPLQGLAGVLDWRMGGRISTMVREGICTGNQGEQVLTLSQTTATLCRIVLLGLGLRAEFTRERGEQAGVQVHNLSQNLHAQEILLGMPHTQADGTDQPALVWAEQVVRACRSSDAAPRLWLLAQRECVGLVEQHLAEVVAS